MPPADHRIPDLRRQPFEALGVVVRRRRKAAGMTQEELEATSTLHVTYLRGIEAGRRNPSIQVQWLLAQGLGVPFSTLCAEVEAEVGASNEG